MAVAFRSQAIANTGTTASTSLILAMPAGVLAGDMLIAAVTADLGTGVNFTAPLGWTLMTSTNQGTNIKLSTYWRVADGTEPANYTWSFDVAVQASGAIVAYSGAHPFAPMARANVSNASAGTSLTPAGVNSSYTGFGIQVYATRNTTAAATITHAAGNNERAETTTTASAFIGLEVQDTPKSFPVGGVSTATSTSSQAVTYMEHTFFLSDARPELNIMGIDELTAGSNTTATTTTNIPAFSTNYPDELLVCIVGIGKTVQTVSGISGGTGLTWEFVGRSNTLAGSIEVWRAWAKQLINREAITITFTGSVTGCNTMLMGIRGADNSGINGAGAIGSVVTGTSSASAPSISLTTTRSNSWVWGGANDPDGSSGVTAGSGQTVMRSFSDATNSVTTWMQRRDALTPAPGTSATINNTNPSTHSCNLIAFEIVPARKPRPTALYFD